MYKRQRLYRVIYQAIEDVQKAMKGLLEPEYKDVMLGHAEVRNTFRITGAGTVAGCYVTDGKLPRNAEARLIRDNVVVLSLIHIWFPAHRGADGQAGHYAAHP